MTDWEPPEAADSWAPDEAEHVGKPPAFDAGALVVDPRRALQHATPFGAATVSGALDAMPDEESRARSINQMYVLPRTNYLPRRVAMQNWPAVRDGFAKSIGYTDGPISEGAFTALLQEHAATDKKKVWADAKGPMDRLKLMFGDHGVSDPDLKVEGAVPMIGSEAAGTTGGAFTIPKMQGTGTFTGLVNATNKVVSSLTTPANAGIMVATGGAGALGEIVGTARALTIARATQAAALGTFTAVGVKDTATAWAEARMVLNDPEATDAQKADAIATVALSATMTAFAAKGTYDFGSGAAKSGAAAAANPSEASARASFRQAGEAVKMLRKEQARSMGEVAQALGDAAKHLEEQNKPKAADKTVVDEFNEKLDKIPGGPKEVLPKAATVEELDNGGFVVTDESGKLLDYATDAERAASIKSAYEGTEIKKPAPAEFQGVQEGMPAEGNRPAVPDFELYGLTEDIPGHPKGSTVSRETLERAGYEVSSPLEKPKAEVKAETPTEAKTSPEASGERTIGIKNEAVDRQLKELGLEEGEHGAKVTNAANFELAKTVSENDPLAASRLVERLNKGDQDSVSATEVAMLAREAVRTSNERTSAHERVIEAVKSGDAVELQQAKVDEALAQARYEDTLRAADAAGTSQGQAFQIRQRMLKEDYSLAAMERQAKVVNEVTELAPEKQAEIAQLSERIAATQKAFDEYKAAQEKIIPFPKQGKIATKLSELATGARERIKQRRAEGRAQSGLDPTDLADHAIIGAEYLAKGVKQFAAWSEAMVKEFGDSIKPHLQAIFAKASEVKTEETRLSAKKSRLKTSTEKLKDKIENEDFEKAERKPLHLDEEANRLQAEHDMAKLEYDRLLERDRYQKLPPLAKALRHAADSWDVLRSIKATGELSPILRQGGFTAATHPLMTAKAVPDMLRALVRDEVGAHALNNSVLQHPDLPSARKAGLHIMDEHSSLNAKEEMFAGRLVGKVPGLKRLDRATTVYLNRIRFDLFQELRQGARSSAEEKAIANFVNVSTGRGKLGPLENSSVVLGRVLFSPRFWASRVQMVAGQPMWGGTWNTRRIIAKEYAKGLVAAAGFYAAVSLYKNHFADNPNDVDVGDDPGKSNFGKVRIGNTHVDPLAGLSQHAVYMTRTAEAAFYAAQHAVDPSAQQPKHLDWTDITKNYVQGRIHPTAGLVANILDQHNLVGEKVGVPNTMEDAVKAVAPMTYGDVYDVLRDQDVPEATAISILALLGMSVSVYDENAKRGAKMPSK